MKGLENLLHIVDVELKEAHTFDDAIDPLDSRVPILHPAEMSAVENISSFEVVVDVTGNNEFSHNQSFYVYYILFWSFCT